MDKTIGSLISLAGTIGAVIVLLKLLPAFMLASHGDYVNATDIIINVGVEEIINKVYWAIIVAIASPIIGLFVYLLKK